jgi:hypothetical protein
MKLFAHLSLALMLVTAPSFAAVEECRHIKARTDREACYDRQTKSLAEKLASGLPTSLAPPELPHKNGPQPAVDGRA